MNLGQSRIGILFSPTTPLWTGTVSSYAGAPDFRLTVVTVTGALSTAMVGLAVAAGDELVRIKAVDVGSGYIDLAENGVETGSGQPFATGATLAIYNARFPFPKYQRITGLQVTSSDASLTGITLSGVTSGDTFDFELTSTKLTLYNYWGDRVAVGNYTGPGPVEVNLHERNDSGVNGELTITYSADATGTLTVGDVGFYKDYDISWSDLGASDAARSKASQGPVGICEPAAAWDPGGITLEFNASGSYATYYGEPAGSRVQATLNPASTTWEDGDGTPGGPGATYSPTYLTDGFRYVKMVVVDSNSVTQTRYVPVWIGTQAYEEVTRCTLRWALGRGWQADIEVSSPPDRLRFGLCAVVDLDVTDSTAIAAGDNVLFVGFIWPESVEYTPDKTSVRFTALSDLAYLGNVQAYPFEVTGTQGNPVDWYGVDWLSVYRAAIHLLRWHSNYLEIANAVFGYMSSNQLSDDRKEYKRAVNKASLLDQVNGIAASCKFGVWGRLTGGFSARINPLYRWTNSDATSDALTLDLTAAGMAETVEYERARVEMAQLRLSGYYHDGSLNFLPQIVRAPEHPAQWGNDGEETELIASANTDEDGSTAYTNWAEMLVWAGRQVAVANSSARYQVKALVDIDLETYLMVDAPAPASGDHTAVRLVVEEKTLDHNAAGGYWDQQIIGRTWGVTAGSAVETPLAITLPNPLPILPTPEDEAARSVAVLVKADPTGLLGGVYVTRDITVAYTDGTAVGGFNAAVVAPTWVRQNAISGGGNLNSLGKALSGPLIYDPYDDGGTYRGRGAWLLVDAGTTNSKVSQVYYSADLLPPDAPGAWSATWMKVFEIGVGEVCAQTILPMYDSLASGILMIVVVSSGGYKKGKVYRIGRTLGSDTDVTATWGGVMPDTSAHLNGVVSAAGVTSQLFYGRSTSKIVKRTVGGGADTALFTADQVVNAEDGHAVSGQALGVTPKMVHWLSGPATQPEKWAADSDGWAHYYHASVPEGYVRQGASYTFDGLAALCFGFRYKSGTSEYRYILGSDDDFATASALHDLDYASGWDINQGRITQKVIAGDDNLALVSLVDGDIGEYRVAVSVDGGTTFYWAGLDTGLLQIMWLMETDRETL